MGGDDFGHGITRGDPGSDPPLRRAAGDRRVSLVEFRGREVSDIDAERTDPPRRGSLRRQHELRSIADDQHVSARGERGRVARNQLRARFQNGVEPPSADRGGDALVDVVRAVVDRDDPRRDEPRLASSSPAVPTTTIPAESAD